MTKARRWCKTARISSASNGLRFTDSVQKSRRSSHTQTVPCVIIAGSGMAESGRILHHLLHGAADPRNTIVIVGFQAEGTLGRPDRNGAPVHAQDLR